MITRRAAAENAAPAGVFPLNLALAGRLVVVVGGGPVAARKVLGCLAARADVLVIAPIACEEIVADAAAGRLTWRQRDYRDGDADGAWLVVAATGDLSTDRSVEQQAEAQQTFCIRADDATAGTARSPATLRRDDLVITVGTSATGPGGRADPRRVGAVRTAIADALDGGRLPLRRHRAGRGRVVLVGGGPGEPDLITVRGRRELAAADVVVVDRLAPQAVLDELAPGVLVLDVGKAPGRQPLPQHEINQLLVEHARAGRRVVRLGGCDPYLLGRGEAEVAACREAGVEVDVVPGVSSSPAGLLMSEPDDPDAVPA